MRPRHPATPDQIAAGVVDLPTDLKETLVKLLTFETLPTGGEIEARAGAVAIMLRRHRMHMPMPNGRVAVMIGEAPWMSEPLERALKEEGLVPVYAFSVRESVEVAQPDGSLWKTNVFKHAGFVFAA